MSAKSKRKDFNERRSVNGKYSLYMLLQNSTQDIHFVEMVNE